VKEVTSVSRLRTACYVGNALERQGAKVHKMTPRRNSMTTIKMGTLRELAKANDVREFHCEQCGNESAAFVEATPDITIATCSYCKTVYVIVDE